MVPEASEFSVAPEPAGFPPLPPGLWDDCWFLTGPTACGKTALSLELAHRIDAEILSLDSMAVYRRLEIGTAKPEPAARTAVPHHLLDLVEPDGEFSVAEYVAAARAAAEAVRSRGRQVLFVGGSAMYAKALLRGIFTGPPADWAFRNESAAEEAAEPGVLHRRLAEVDPPAAEKLHPNDTKRLIRALEVHRATGRRLSQLQAEHAMDRPSNCRRFFVLERPRDDLHARIDRRIGAMFAAGWVEEVRALLAAGIVLGRTARQAVGYGEILAHLAGERPLAETIRLIETRTHRFARHQCTWFRGFAEARPIDAALPPDLLAERLAEAGREPRQVDGNAAAGL